jgi:hypothetical protein
LNFYIVHVVTRLALPLSLSLSLDSEIKASARGFLIFSTQRRFDVVDWNGIEELLTTCKDRGRFVMYSPHGGKWEWWITSPWATSTFGGPLGLKRGGVLCVTANVT